MNMPKPNKNKQIIKVQHRISSDEKKFLQALGQRVNHIRKAKNISFQELSYRCDIEKSNLVKLTTKGTNITASSLYRIANALEVPVAEFFMI